MAGTFTLAELVDLALCTPEVGAVNFNILRILLLELLERLGIVNATANLNDLQSHQINNFQNYIQGAGTASPMPGVLRISPTTIGGPRQDPNKTPRTERIDQTQTQRQPAQQPPQPQQNIQGMQKPPLPPTAKSQPQNIQGAQDSNQPPPARTSIQPPPPVQASAQHPQVQTSTQPPQVQTSTQPPQAQTSTQPPPVQASTQPPPAQAFTQPSLTQPPPVQTSTQLPAAQASTQPPPIQASTQPSPVQAKRPSASAPAQPLPVQNIRQSQDGQDQQQQGAGTASLTTGVIENFPTTHGAQGQDPNKTPKTEGIDQMQTRRQSAQQSAQPQQNLQEMRKPSLPPTTKLQSQNIQGAQASTQPPPVQTSTQPPQVQTSTQPPQVQTSTQPPQVQTSTQPPQVQASTQPPAVQTYAQPPQVQGQRPSASAPAQLLPVQNIRQSQDGQDQQQHGAGTASLTTGVIENFPTTPGAQGQDPNKTPKTEGIDQMQTRRQSALQSAQPQQNLQEMRKPSLPPTTKLQSQNIQEAQASTQPPQVQTSTQPPQVQTSTQPPQVQTSTQPPQAQTSTQPPLVQASTQPPLVQASTQPPAGQSSTQPSPVQAQRPSASAPAQPLSVQNTRQSQDGQDQQQQDPLTTVQYTHQSQDGQDQQQQDPLTTVQYTHQSQDGQDQPQQEPLATVQYTHQSQDGQDQQQQKPVTTTQPQDVQDASRSLQHAETNTPPLNKDTLQQCVEDIYEQAQASFQRSQKPTQGRPSQTQGKYPYMAIGVSAKKCLGPGICSGFGLPAGTAVCQFPQQEDKVDICKKDEGKDVRPCKDDPLHHLRYPGDKQSVGLPIAKPGLTSSKENLLRQFASMTLLPKDLDDLAQKMRERGVIPDVFDEAEVLEKIATLWEAIGVLKSNEENIAVRLLQQDAILKKINQDQLDSNKSVEKSGSALGLCAKGKTDLDSDDIQLIYNNISSLVLDNTAIKEKLLKINDAMLDVEQNMVTKPMLMNAMSDKADRGAMNTKVSFDEFGAGMDEVTSRLGNLLQEVHRKNELWKEITDNMRDDLSEKLDKVEIGPLRAYFKSHMGKLEEKVNHLCKIMDEPDPAGTRKKLLKDYNCISCDRRTNISGVTNSPLVPCFGAAGSAAGRASQRAFELYRMRPSTTKYDPESRNYCQMERQERGDGMGGDIILNESEMMHLVNRYVGGSHTAISNQDRMAAMHNRHSVRASAGAVHVRASGARPSQLPPQTAPAPPQQFYREE